MQLVILDEQIDIGLGVGPGFINGAAGADVKDRVHIGNPFGSFVAGQKVPYISTCYQSYPCCEWDKP